MARMKLFVIIAILLCADMAAGDRIAWLVDGGYGPVNNHAGFSMQTQGLYQGLLDKGYEPRNIYVLATDGRDNDLPAWTSPMDRPDYSSPFFPESREYDAIWYFEGYGGEQFTTWVDSPKGYFHSDTVVMDATYESFEAMTLQMQASGSPDDELFVALINHGGNEADVFQFGIWDYQQVSADDWKSAGALMDGTILADYMDRIPYDKRVIAVATCHAAVAWNQLGNDRTVMLANCGADELGWLSNPVLDQSTLIPPFALNPAGGFGISLIEGLEESETWADAFDYAYEHDMFGPIAGPYWVGGQYGWVTEHPELIDPSGLAATWVIPEPATMLILAVGAMAVKMRKTGY